MLDFCAFCGANLTTITIPKSVSTIGYLALECDNLTTINYEGTQAEWEALTDGVDLDLPDGVTINYNYKY